MVILSVRPLERGVINLLNTSGMLHLSTSICCPITKIFISKLQADEKCAEENGRDGPSEQSPEPAGIHRPYDFKSQISSICGGISSLERLRYLNRKKENQSKDQNAEKRQDPHQKVK